MTPAKSRAPNLLRKLQSRVLLGLGVAPHPQITSDHGHQIQMRLLPNETPHLEGFQIACAWQPSRQASGDYFDVLPLSDSRFGFCIADVAGKGTPAALLMANLHASVKAFAQDDVAPSTLCSQLNAVLCNNIGPARYITFFYGLLDRDTRALRYESAGHCLPLLVRANGSIQIPEASSGVLGLFSHWTYSDHELRLASGDVLVMMTDGVLESANAKEEEFGYKRLIASVLASRSEGAHHIRLRILEEVTAFCGGNFADDASFIVLAVD
jgi:sigma-B regulation protein RsbU (phosphoserine phosphatase)